MSLSPQEAAAQLEHARKTQMRSAQAFGYSLAAPHLILWGIVWIVGFVSTDLLPIRGRLVWPILLVAAWLLTIFMHRRQGERINPTHAYRALGIIIAITAFIFAVYAVFGPPSAKQAAVLPALIVGVMYFGMGFWIGWRMIAIGTGIFVLALVGYFQMSAHLPLLLAALGGGALILGGLWLRRV